MEGWSQDLHQLDAKKWAKECFDESLQIQLKVLPQGPLQWRLVATRQQVIIQLGDLIPHVSVTLYKLPNNLVFFFLTNTQKCLCNPNLIGFGWNGHKWVLRKQRNAGNSVNDLVLSHTISHTQMTASQLADGSCSLKGNQMSCSQFPGHGKWHNSYMDAASTCPRWPWPTGMVVWWRPQTCLRNIIVNN